MKIIDSKSMGKIVKQFRLEHQLTQAETAKVLNCSRSAYCYKENGATSFSIEDIQRLAVLFHVLPEAFFHSRASQNPTNCRQSRRKGG